ncbi:MAG: membrane dipeptidase [Polyangiaceae bacterium]|nr:membrane dipeptidase [Polyangiaceae bacterium]
MTKRATQSSALVWLFVTALGCGGGDAAHGAPSSAGAPSGSSAADGSATASSAASVAAQASATQAPEDPDAPFEVIDLHVDTPYEVHMKNRPVSLPEGHATPDALRAGHYVGIVYPLYIADYMNHDHPRVADAEALLGTIDRILAAHPDLLHREGAGSAAPVTAYLSIEGGGAFAEDVTAIDRFIARGVRLVGLVHAHDSPLATSATGKDRKRGLSDQGKELGRRVYAAGALVDVSHMSDASFADVVPLAKAAGAPIVATHSNARAVAKHKRNLTDEQLRAIAASGGVAGLNFHGPYLRTAGKAKLADVVVHAKHMIEVAGIEHVAIGSDFDGGNPPKGLGDASKLPDLAQALLAAGLSRADVRKIFSGNARRVLAWQPAAPPR